MDQVQVPALPPLSGRPRTRRLTALRPDLLTQLAEVMNASPHGSALHVGDSQRMLALATLAAVGSSNPGRCSGEICVSRRAQAGSPLLSPQLPFVSSPGIPWLWEFW